MRLWSSARSVENALSRKSVDHLEATGARSLIACPARWARNVPTAPAKSFWAIRSWCARRVAPSITVRAGGSATRCGSYTCTPARRPSLEREVGARADDHSIRSGSCGSAARVGAADGVCRFRQFATWTVSRDRVTAGVNKLAIASLICGIAGIPLFGLITGLVAVFLGVFALAAIRATGQRGLVLASPG